MLSGSATFGLTFSTSTTEQECENPAGTFIWLLVKQAWPSVFGQWSDITLGLIQGCGNIDLFSTDDERKKNWGPSRLLRTLISESAHLLRCERTIQGLNWHSPRSHWQNKLNHRITLDTHIATTPNRKPITCKLHLGGDPPRTLPLPWTKLGI